MARLPYGWHIEQAPVDPTEAVIEPQVDYTVAGPCKVIRADGSVTVLPPLDRDCYTEVVLKGEAKAAKLKNQGLTL